MSDYQIVDSDEAAVALADFLHREGRKRPTAVVTMAAGQSGPYIDVDEIARELGGLADVYLITAGPHTWTFSSDMSEGTQVYGGAGRVYPVGLEWVQDLSRSPLRFAWGRSEGAKATQRLVEDGLDMAAAAGLLGSDAATATVVRRTGVVRRADNERAWVDFGNGGFDLGVVPPQLAEPELPIERVLRPGMTVTGHFDPETHWFDVREDRLDPCDALADYQIGDVVLAEIGEVAQDGASARLLPSVVVRLSRADVTPDDDDLRTLLTRGEVVSARVLASSPWWLTLLEVDEEPVPAASVFAGGPPWLEAAREEEVLPEPLVEHPKLAVVLPTDDGANRLARPAVQMDPALTGPVVSPALMPRHRGDRAPAVPPPARPPAVATGGAVRDMALKVDGLQAEVRLLTSELAALRDEVRGVRAERQQLEVLLNSAEQRAARLEAELKRSRSALRKASLGRAASAPAFADRERGFRNLVEASWAQRIPLAEQLDRPLPDYALGPRFLETVEALEGVSLGKIADVAVELLTGIAQSIAGRDMHRLRTGSGGGDPVLEREDGAMCWPIALQANTPSARRLHAWRLTDGRWELSSVRKHDDVEP